MTSRPAEPGARPAMPVSLAAALRPAMLIALIVTLLRVVYLRAWCPYDLVEDEAQYWLWSQFPDWSYYSKGPGVAWAIGAFTRLLGDEEWAVRLPAAVSGLVAMFAAAGLGAETAAAAGADERGVRRAGLFALAAFALAPVFQMTALIMTIDGPLVACWLVAAWAGLRAMLRGSRSAWIVLGAAVAAGFLFKYTMLLVVPGLVGFAIARRSRLAPARGWAAWAAAAVSISFLGLVPVVVWNAQHHWDTVRHLLGHLGMRGGDMPAAAGGGSRWSAAWPFVLIGSQIALAGPGLVLGIFAALRTRRESMGVGASLLIWCAAPILLFYLVVSLFAEPEGNWPIAGSTTLLVLAGAWASGAIGGPAAAWGWRRFTPRRFVWNLAVLLGVLVAPVLLRADWAARAVTRAAQVVDPDIKPIRTGRLIGARAMGEHAGRVLAQLDEEAGETGRSAAFVIVEHYGRASQLSYYLPGRPTVYCASAAMGGRRSQFDLWAHTSLRDPALLGRDALLLSNDKPHTLEFWRSVFESVTPLDGQEPSKLEGEHKKDRVAYIGRGYRGLGTGQGAVP